MRRPADDNLPALTPAPRRGALISPLNPAPSPLPAPRSSGRARGAASAVLTGLLLVGALGAFGAGAALDFAPPASASSAAPSAATAPVIAAAIAPSPTLAPFPTEPLAAPTITAAPAAPASAPNNAAASHAVVAAAPPAALAPQAAVSVQLPAPAAPPPAAAQAQPQQQRQAPALAPVNGVITTEFGSGHGGIDIGAASGAPVAATAAGVVRAVYDWQVSYGRHVIVDHGGGWESLYAHLLNVALPPGQPVAAGQTIGWIGSTGRSTGPHLHFELRYRGRALDPLPYFQPR